MLNYQGFSYSSRISANLFLAFLSMLYIFTANADIIPENHLPVEVAVYITNTDSLESEQGYSLVACIEDIMASAKSGCYKIQDDTLIQKGYKFNTLRIIAIETDVLNSLGTLIATRASEINPDNQVSVTLLSLSRQIGAPEILSSGTVYVAPEYPMDTDTYYYRASGVEGDTLSVELKRRVVSFTDGRDVTEIEY